MFFLEALVHLLMCAQTNRNTLQLALCGGGGGCGGCDCMWWWLYVVFLYIYVASHRCRNIMIIHKHAMLVCKIPLICKGNFTVPLVLLTSY